MTDLPAAFRDATTAELPMVYSDWLRSYRKSPITRAIPNDVFFADHGHHGVVERAIGAAELVVACSPEDPAQVYGWCCFVNLVGAPPGNPPLLHYLYVKSTFRGAGVARRLLEAFGLGDGPLQVTHWTHAADRAKDRGRQLIFNPYLLE